MSKRKIVKKKISSADLRAFYQLCEKLWGEFALGEKQNKKLTATIGRGLKKELADEWGWNRTPMPFGWPSLFQLIDGLLMSVGHSELGDWLDKDVDRQLARAALRSRRTK